MKLIVSDPVFVSVYLNQQQTGTMSALNRSRMSATWHEASRKLPPPPSATKPSSGRRLHGCMNVAEDKQVMLGLIFWRPTDGARHQTV
jgi:hypothetical protein